MQKTIHRVAQTSVRLISHSRELWSKNCIVKRPEMLIIWSALHCCVH